VHVGHIMHESFYFVLNFYLPCGFIENNYRFCARLLSTGFNSVLC